MLRPSLLTFLYTWHMGSRWYTTDYYSHHRHVSICLTVTYPGLEVTGEWDDSLLHFGICCKSLASQMLLKRSKKKKNSGTIMKNQSPEKRMGYESQSQQYKSRTQWFQHLWIFWQPPGLVTRTLISPTQGQKPWFQGGTNAQISVVTNDGYSIVFLRLWLWLRRGN